ncbi:MAG: class I SAM-dependent RNA methyltransferase [Pyrinomonadaceae bacterium]
MGPESLPIGELIAVRRRGAANPSAGTPGERKAKAASSSSSPLVGRIVQVEIERIVPGGLGLAHAEGRTLFVSLAAPGDHARVVIERVRGKSAFASIVEITRPSSARVRPPCPYFGRCGGCDFQQLNYDAQLAAKLEIIRDCLRRIAGIDLPPGLLRIIRAPDEWRYRARAQWQFDAERGAFGYYERGTHRVVDVAACPVLVPELQNALEQLRKDTPANHSGGEFQVVAGEDGVSLATGADHQVGQLVSRVIRGERYFFSANGFFQINHQLLADLVEEAVRDYAGDTALDLYCGVGLFSLPLARRFARVIGVEGNPGAVRLAERNAREASLGNLQFATDGVEQWLAHQVKQLTGVDLILLDPPRAGAGQEIIEAVLRIAPRCISYVSCDPATLARDLRALTASYRVETITALDMFPQTHHVETVAQLKRKDR